MARLRARWVEALVALDAVVAGLMVAVGTYLLDPTIADLGFYLEAGRHALAGGLLVYAGIVLAHAAVFGSTPAGAGFAALIRAITLGRGALFGVAAILLALAWRALTADPPIFWVSLLAIPGVLALLSFPFAGSAASRDHDATEEAETTGDSGKTKPTSIGREYLLIGLVSALTAIVFGLYLSLGFFLYVLLDASLIDDIDLDLGRVVEVALPAFLDRLWPIWLGIAAALLVVLPLVGMVIALGARIGRRLRPDFERDLTAGEVSYITRGVAQVKDHVERHGYRARAQAIGRTALLALLAGMAGALGLSFAFDDVVAAAYAPAGEDWHLYSVDGLIAVVALLIAVPSLAFVPGALAALWSRSRGEAGALLMLGALATYEPVRAAMVRLVRARKLSPGKAFDAGAFLWAAGCRYSVAALIWAAASAGAVAAVWPHDRMLDTLYTDDGIETGDFWSLERTRTSYADVTAVQLECRFGRDDDTVIGYALRLPGDVRRELVTQSRLEAYLDDLLKVDGKLREAGVPFVFALPEEAETARASVLDRMCVVEISKGLDEAGREKVERLFHLEEWFERRWRQRTRTPQISSY